MPSFDIKGKICVVTGGGSGIGEALCLHFARNGAARVCVVDMNLEAATRVATAIDGVALAANCASEMDIRKVRREFGARIGMPTRLFR